MFYIESCNSNPYYNAALEEYLFREKEGADFFLTYFNTPSVIAGRSNNIQGNIFFKNSQKNVINIVRGFSDGMNLYTDNGCINFTLITNQKYNTAVTLIYRSFLNKLNDVFNENGYHSQLTRNNELIYNGKEIIACNRFISGKRNIIKCVLYLQADLNSLNKIFSKKNKCYLSSYNKKQKDTFGNLLYNVNATDFDKIKGDIHQMIIAVSGCSQSYQLSESEYNAVLALMLEKYMSWEWNFAQDYEYRRKCSVHRNSLSIYLKVRNGIITLSRILVNNNPLFSDSDPLKGLQHSEYDICCFFTKYKKHIHRLGISSRLLSTYFF